MHPLETVAFYLPQFYPTPENDEFWGEGFTEWTNVAQARPLYPGHEQRLLPGALGFYDLRLPETRSAQADLARRHGITAFCYWHYWFGLGQRALTHVFEEVLTTGEPDFPFCLGWANGSWTASWVGDKDRLLIPQTYDDRKDESHHFDFLVRAFRDPRYLRVDGRPLFYVYNPHRIPEAKAFTKRLRDHCRTAGIGEIYLVGEVNRLGWNPLEGGFDAAACTSPWPMWVRARRSGRLRTLRRAADVACTLIFRVLKLPEIRSYRSLAPHMIWSLDEFGMDEPSFPVVVPRWDNTPRRRRKGIVLRGSTPALFARQVRQAVELVRRHPDRPQILFIKSWNEWAEGNVVEPSREWGSGYLDAFSEAVGAEGLEPPTSSL